MILLSHPTANDTARHVALALNRAGVLGEFWSCSPARGAPHLIPLTPAALAAASAAASFPSHENGSFIANGLGEPGARERHSPSLDDVCRTLDRTVSTRLASERFKGVYAYEDGADESFRTAGERGLLRIYNLVAGHWLAEHDICTEEAALEPEWAATLTGPPGSSRASSRKDSELQQADLVFVGSSFMLSTVEQVPSLPATVAMLSPGALTATHTPVSVAGLNGPMGKLRVLFVGPLGQRKGLSYLFRACRALRPAVSLTVIGRPPAVACPALERELRSVRWLPECSAEELRTEMAAHDVFLAPSVFEGFDPVMLDALGAGLPVIATPHTAAPDLVDDGVEGFIVPVRSTEQIVAKLELLRREPERRAAMSASARLRAQQHSWENYERTLAASVATALARH